MAKAKNPGIRILSWNVNGIRAVSRKGFLEWLREESPDILCMQETRVFPGQLEPPLREPEGYQSFWMPGRRKGYSGVATYVGKGIIPGEMENLGIEEFDHEGRVQIIPFSEFTLINAYFPNSQDQRNRLNYKLSFFEAIKEKCLELVSSGHSVILCGDYNVAHTEIDLARPKENQDSPGFYPEERSVMGDFLESGFVDTFRNTHPGEEGHYTWWSYRTRARQRNVGWRIDYHCVNRDFLPRVKRSVIRPDVMGSDHCPVELEIV